MSRHHVCISGLHSFGRLHLASHIPVDVLDVWKPEHGMQHAMSTVVCRYASHVERRSLLGNLPAIACAGMACTTGARPAISGNVRNAGRESVMRVAMSCHTLSYR